MKLEVGMYAYSKKCRDYGIGKIVNITENGLGFKGDLIDIQYRHSKHAIENHDVIASFNIIDILEVGDAIEIDVIDEDNYPTITGINFVKIGNKEELVSIKDMFKNESAKLLTVITHEQIEQRAYKVGE